MGRLRPIEAAYEEPSPIMIDTLQVADKNHFLAQFDRLETQLPGHGLPWVRHLRRAAFARFEELGFPTARNEDWRFTNVADLARQTFEILTDADDQGINADTLQHAGLRSTSGLDTCKVFVNGFQADRLCSGDRVPEGVQLFHFANALGEQVEPHLAALASYDNHPFVALNTAFFQDGGVLLIAPGTVIDRPIFLVFVNGPHDKPLATHPRNLVVAGKGSRVTLVEAYLGLEDNKYFTNAVTEITLGEGAVIDHYKVQRESRQAYHVAATQVQQARGSVFRSHYIGLGGALVRNETRVVLAGEGCECTLNGLYVAGDTQHADNLTAIDHAYPRCASHELYKGILNGKARGVFNGKIIVRQDAQKTDAKQTNKTLLLSDDATIHTKPQLEIFADDVKCTHGATVGQLAGDALFYARTRGLGLDQARSLLTFAFANDILRNIKVESLRRELEDFFLAAQHLPADARLEDTP
jgi:Fe-S cluster assembly protein SufD